MYASKGISAEVWEMPETTPGETKETEAYIYMVLANPSDELWCRQSDRHTSA
jgi:hypothetical protein